MSRPLKVTVLLTHPVQYMTPWFRHIAEREPALDLTVIYAAEPTPAQQGTGFGEAFSWDVPLTEGYRCRVVRTARDGEEVGSGTYRGLDVPEAAEALLATEPDVALIPGWHSVTYTRALAACRRAGVPVLYRGDSTLQSAPEPGIGGWRRLAWGLVTRRRLARYDGYLAVGSRAASYLRFFGVSAERIFPCPHSVDAAAFEGALALRSDPERRREVRASFGLPADAFVPLFVGKLEAKKRPLDLVRAGARLVPGSHLLMVGSGRLAEDCRREAERLGVAASLPGFLNQSELPRAYAAADCLVLPSDGRETWGLVVNEALAAGLPAVVSQEVGCAPDLVVPGMTGERVPVGDTALLAEALGTVRRRLEEAGDEVARACRERSRLFSYERATEGLRAAAEAVMLPRRRFAPASGPRGKEGRPTRIFALCGHMVVVSGLERMTFEILSTALERGADVACAVNHWENHRIVERVDALPAPWVVETYPGHLQRRGGIRTWILNLWAIVGASLALLRDAAAFRPTHVLLPDHLIALRNAPALLLLRALGTAAVLRLPNRPESSPYYRRLWGRVLPLLVDRMVANSAYTEERLLALGAPAEKVRRVENVLVSRPEAPPDPELEAWMGRRPTLLTVGQIAPFKGTHLAVEAALTLLAEGRDLQALIVGRAPGWPPELAEYHRDLLARVEEAGMEDRVRFAGHREDVPRLMRLGHLLVAPIPEEEGFGLVALEAKAAGLPVVAFPAGAMEALVDHGVTGYLCRDETPGGLLAGLRSFLDHPERREAASRASLAAMARPDSPYRREVFAEAWWQVFEESRR